MVIRGVHISSNRETECDTEQMQMSLQCKPEAYRKTQKQGRIQPHMSEGTARYRWYSIKVTHFDFS